MEEPEEDGQRRRAEASEVSAGHACGRVGGSAAVERGGGRVPGGYNDEGVSEQGTDYGDKPASCAVRK
ncbi:hypothetical protein AGMMS49936_10890 [Endomicrobiia bacterium]|nr:hypothetical protein AGMMS49936_10890 [Endomicrobiia bacterium]